MSNRSPLLSEYLPTGDRLPASSNHPERPRGELNRLVQFVLDSGLDRRSNALFAAACRLGEHAAADRLRGQHLTHAELELLGAALRIGLDRATAEGIIRFGQESGYQWHFTTTEGTPLK